MARTTTGKVNLKDGYYIEVCKQGVSNGIKIRRESYEGIQLAIKMYEKFYEVNYLGKLENGKKVNEKNN